MGILDTVISSMSPAEADCIVDKSVILDVLTPTLNVSVKFTIEVLKPDIDTQVWSFISNNGKKLALTRFLSNHSKTAPS